jgi:TolB-like protein
MNRRLILPAALALAACRATAPQTPTPRRAAERAAREAVANERALDPASLGARTIGVVPLTVTGPDTTFASLGYAMADLLVTDLSQSAELRLVERGRVDALLRELSLGAGGHVDTVTAPRVGRLIGARRLVVGDVTVQPGGALQVNARVADASTGTLAGGVTAATTTADVLAAEKGIAFLLFQQLGVNLTPAERAAVDRRPTSNLTALLAYGRAVHAEAEGRYDAAFEEYRKALKADPGFMLAASHMRDLVPVVGGAFGLLPSTRSAVATATERLAPGIISPAVGGANPGGPADATFPARGATVVIIITSAP